MIFFLIEKRNKIESTYLHTWYIDDNYIHIWYYNFVIDILKNKIKFEYM